MSAAFSEYINFSGDFGVWIWKIDPAYVISFILNQFVLIVDIAIEHAYCIPGHDMYNLFN